MTDTAKIYKSGYWIAGILAVLSFFGAVPTWVPVVIGVGAFVLNWQSNIQNRKAREAIDDDLYARYAPDLKRDFVQDGANILDRIDALKAKDPEMMKVMASVMAAFQVQWQAKYKEPLPQYMHHALLRDFEYINKFDQMDTQIARATSYALMKRLEDFDLWLKVTGTKITDEEVEASERELRGS
ncbi:hypothetical protein [Polynucleobacter sp. UB-Raua-W9]|uniref:hypothetical protein n=1 Tax=Polynucleobacter sp. UB-Raua-W9 TaxID=1819736 RepID=UPI001BFECFC7|nr:hypothetical protein [Polynucleobacter sp. UB-Raua-W9]QWD71581.1 hypothetical protein AOC07_04770 [Polynucleobacter sp. UB-Raua-W9]